MLILNISTPNFLASAIVGVQVNYSAIDRADHLVLIGFEPEDESLKIDKTRKISVLARACAIFQIETSIRARKYITKSWRNKSRTCK